MSFVDFCHYFSRVQVCCIRDNFTYTSIKGKHEKGDRSIIRMVLERDTHLYLTVSQKDKRSFPKDSDYEYLNTRLIVAKIKEDGGLEYMFGKMKVDREVWEEEDLESGEYLCYVEVGTNFVLSAYSRHETFFTRDESNVHPQFLEKVYESCALKYGDMTSFENEGAPDCKKYSKMLPEGYGFNFFLNDSTEGSIREVVTYTRFNGLELVRPFRDSGYEVLVPPK